MSPTRTIGAKNTRALYIADFRTGGPAIVGGTMLLLNEIALALFVGLGPLFILCLLFDQTKPLFGRWLYYGIGTMFSMAVLSAMVSIALEMVIRVSSAFWGTAIIGGLLKTNFTDGMTSQAMQQGGLGLILTTLIVTAPPMAASFFQGTLGQFSPYNVFGNSSAGNSYPPGTGPAGQGYVPSRNVNTEYNMSAASVNNSYGATTTPSVSVDSAPKAYGESRRGAGE